MIQSAIRQRKRGKESVLNRDNEEERTPEAANIKCDGSRGLAPSCREAVEESGVVAGARVCKRCAAVLVA